MWLNNTMIVDLLFKCTRQFTHRSNSHPDVEEQRGPHKTTFRVCNHSCDENQQTVQSTRSFGRNTPQIAKRSLVKERNLTIYHSYTGNRSRRSLDNVHVAKFTLLIDELSWANGNPRFVYNRPVFFIAQSAVCLSKNMRLVIVYGQYCFDSPINTEESVPVPRVATTYCPNSLGLKSTRTSLGGTKKPEITNYRRAILPPASSDERSRAGVLSCNLIVLFALFVYL
ncbi:hypothetical protein CRM22_005686 [Opisthorchis felineus]|nr:hypothetical protein CRM22_005686 [Opisthorchis felineus]TGZ65770.1 hypothetical protein CRM22_005686 [Opisthorchis felineus]